MRLDCYNDGFCNIFIITCNIKIVDLLEEVDIFTFVVAAIHTLARVLWVWISFLSTIIDVMRLAYRRWGWGLSEWPCSAFWTRRIDPPGSDFLPLLAHHSLNCLSIVTTGGTLGGGTSAKVLLTSVLYILKLFMAAAPYNIIAPIWFRLLGYVAPKVTEPF